MLWYYFQKGGWIMYPLALLSLFALGFVLERWQYFRRLNTDPHLWFQSLKFPLQKDFLTGLKNHPLASVLKAMWAERDRLSPKELESLAQEEAEYEIHGLEKNLKALGVIAVLSPLLGLLGTVWGIMKAFHQTAEATQVDPTRLAGGIWEALITTFVGLSIAIPTWALYYYFENRLNRTAFQLEFFSSRFLRLADSPAPKGNEQP